MSRMSLGFDISAMKEIVVALRTLGCTQPVDKTELMKAVTVVNVCGHFLEAGLAHFFGQGTFLLEWSSQSLPGMIRWKQGVNGYLKVDKVVASTRHRIYYLMYISGCLHPTHTGALCWFVHRRLVCCFFELSCLARWF